MELRKDISKRFKSAYGIVPVFVATDRRIPGSQYMPIVGAVDVYQNVNTDSAFEDTQFINTDFDLSFSGGNLTKSGRLGNVFAPPVMMGFRKIKKMIVTSLDGDAGEVVERFGDGSWEIQIQGILVDMENHIFPMNKLNQLVKMFDYPGVFDVVGDMWESHGIKSVWFNDFIDSGVQGYQDTVQFSVTARSIKPVEFYLNGEEE